MYRKLANRLVNHVYNCHTTNLGSRVARRRPGRSLGFNTIWASMRETLTLFLANNKGTDQPAPSRCLVSAFVIRFLKSNATRSESSTFSFLCLFFVRADGVRHRFNIYYKTKAFTVLHFLFLFAVPLV